MDVSKSDWSTTATKHILILDIKPYYPHNISAKNVKDQKNDANVCTHYLNPDNYLIQYIFFSLITKWGVYIH